MYAPKSVARSPIREQIRMWIRHGHERIGKVHRETLTSHRKADGLSIQESRFESRVLCSPCH